MPTLRTQVLGVSQRQVGRDNRTIYDVQLGDGSTYSTFNGEIAGKAIGFVGIGEIEAETNVKTAPGRNGQMYTNLYLEDLKQVSGETVVGSIVPLNQHNAQSSILANVPHTPSSGGMPKEREERITRMNVLGTAFKFMGDLYAGAGPDALEEAETKARYLARTLYDIAYYGPQVPSTPQEVADQVPDVSVGMPEERAKVAW